MVAISTSNYDGLDGPHIRRPEAHTHSLETGARGDIYWTNGPWIGDFTFTAKTAWTLTYWQNCPPSPEFRSTYIVINDSIWKPNRSQFQFVHSGVAGTYNVEIGNQCAGGVSVN